MLESSSDQQTASLMVIPMAAALVLSAVGGAVIGILWESSKEASALAESAAAEEAAEDTAEAS